MNTRLAKKIAQQYINAQQPLRLQPDYGERNAADFLGDRSVARNTGYGENLKAGPGNAYDEVVADNFADFLGDEDLMSEIISDLEADETESFEIIDDLGEDEIIDDLDEDEIIDDLDEDEIIDDLGRMAEFWKESRLPSRKHNPDSVVDKAVAKWREDNPEVAEKFDEEKVENEEEMNEKMKQADEIVDDIGLGRMASSHSTLINFAKRIFRDTPIHVELESDYDGTDILIHWDISNVYDEEDLEGYTRREIKQETKGKIESTDLLNLLNKSYKLIGKFHEGSVERGTSDISEGVFRIRIHDDHIRSASDRTATDHEHSGSYMSRQNLREIDDMADFIVDDIGMEDLDDWVEDKISHAHAAMNDVARYRGYGHRHPHSEDNLKLSKWNKEDIDNFALGLLAESDEDIIDDLED